MIMICQYSVLTIQLCEMGSWLVTNIEMSEYTDQTTRNKDEKVWLDPQTTTSGFWEYSLFQSAATVPFSHTQNSTIFLLEHYFV